MEKQVSGDVSPYVVNNVTICIDRLGSDVFEGRVYHEQLKKEVGFTELGMMLRLIDDMQDAFQFPEASTLTRYFGQRKRKLGEGENAMDKQDKFENIEITENVENGSKATFVVQIQYRQNATWQGNVKWLETNEEMKFRSALELVKMIDQAMADGKEDDQE